VAIRLAKQSGWTIWIETTCPECSKIPAAVPVTAPAAPVMLPVDAATSVAEESSAWSARMKAQLVRVPAGV
jgi:hypothetical protein